MSTNEPWPTGLFDCCSGGKSLCLWGFVCPIWLQDQSRSYSYLLGKQQMFNHPPEDRLTESQFERFPPWSCGGDDPWSPICFMMAPCIYGFAFGSQRHLGRDFQKLEYYCSSREFCCCDFSVEDCLIGYFCCCCSVIQVAMVFDEMFRKSLHPPGKVNIKRAH